MAIIHLIKLCFLCLVYLYKRFSTSPRIYDIACQIYHHLQVTGKGKFNCCLDLVVYDNSIGITIEDN